MGQIGRWIAFAPQALSRSRPGARTTRCMCSDAAPVATEQFLVMDERVSFQRYQTVYERLIRYPNGKRVSFDVFGSPASNFQSVFIFPFNSKTRTATVLREYAPGINGLTWGFPAGGYDPKKHDSLEHAARMELSEEAFLKGGTFYPLTPQGISQDKYSKNTFHMFLAINPTVDENPAPRDEEEYIKVMHGVELSEVRKILGRGGMNVCSSFCGYRALDVLSNPSAELEALLQ
eukprot:Plantae.Rhodophyta-Purpureofilum_apyrenoidigerum.ctg10978.p1 GENE.Plantae.Rhodophyta-Purpureofilum_apyrenoidigerum.ctg10978~~Plantae.Rhodophyta-Purpureofilum_apyrenoidigerum.ctg10978.p1  ORF type:complete len:233 (+),score=23.00 Plantae.Rhodophyta-Purpureofilum_apyrenoidigerum.ctg10978:85-783(+)